MVKVTSFINAGSGPGFSFGVRAWKEMRYGVLKACFRGGTGISKVVRPLQIKDHLCMRMVGGGATIGNVRQ